MTELTQIKKWIDDFYGEERCFVGFVPRRKHAKDEFNHWLYDENDNPVYEIKQIPIVVIYYPEITVQSSSNRNISHKVVDCWLKFEDFDTSPTFTRTSLTVGEYDSRYFHSHASQNTFGSWSTICTGGSDSPFAQAFTGFCENAKLGELSEELMWYYLTAFEEGLQTESTRTNPHIKISSINNGTGKYFWNSCYGIGGGNRIKYVSACLEPKYNITTDEFYYEKDEVEKLLMEMNYGNIIHSVKGCYTEGLSPNLPTLAVIDGVYYYKGTVEYFNKTISNKMEILPDKIIDCKIIDAKPVYYIQSVPPDYIMGTLKKLNTEINDWYKQYKQDNPQLEG